MQVGYDDHAWPAAKILAPLGSGPWGKKINEQPFTAIAALRVPTATPVAEMKIAKGFRVELLYAVPKDQEGSWLCMCLDTKGQMIVCDQHGGLYRLTLPPLDKNLPPIIETIDVDIGEAQGLLWAFDSLYVNVNKATKYPHGLYRVRDTNGDDKLDRVESLRAFASGGEYGWRNGAGKWPPYYLDSVGAVVNVGPGSPTGITFGYGTAFPAKHQDALSLCDCSYGKIYALHLTSDGASYTGQLEEFVAGSPLLRCGTIWGTPTGLFATRHESHWSINRLRNGKN